MKFTIVDDTYVFTTNSIEVYDHAIIEFRGTFNESLNSEIFRTKYKELPQYLDEINDSFFGVGTAFIITPGYCYEINIVDYNTNITKRIRHDIIDYNVKLAELRSQDNENLENLQSELEEINYSYQPYLLHQLNISQFRAYQEYLKDETVQKNLNLLFEYYNIHQSIIPNQSEIENSPILAKFNSWMKNNQENVLDIAILLIGYNLEILTTSEFVKLFRHRHSKLSHKDIEFLQFLSSILSHSNVKIDVYEVISRFLLIASGKRFYIDISIIIDFQLRSMYASLITPILTSQLANTLNTMASILENSTNNTIPEILFQNHAVSVYHELIHIYQSHNSLEKLFSDQIEIEIYISIIRNFLYLYYQNKDSGVFHLHKFYETGSSVRAKYLELRNDIFKEFELDDISIETRIYELEIFNPWIIQLILDYDISNTTNDLVTIIDDKFSFPDFSILTNITARNLIIIYYKISTIYRIYVNQSDKFRILDGTVFYDLDDTISLLEKQINTSTVKKRDFELERWLEKFLPYFHILKNLHKIANNNPEQLVKKLKEFTEKMIFHENSWYRLRLMRLMWNILIYIVDTWQQYEAKDLREFIDLVEQQYIDPSVEIQYLDKELLAIRLLRSLLNDQPMDPAIITYLDTYLNLDLNNFDNELDKISNIIDQINQNNISVSMPVELKDGLLSLMKQDSKQDDNSYTTDLPIFPPELYDLIGMDRIFDYLKLYLTYYLLQDKFENDDDFMEILHKLENLNPEINSLKRIGKELSELRRVYPHLIDRVKIEIMRIDVIIHIVPEQAFTRLKKLLETMRLYQSPLDDYLEVYSLLVKITKILNFTDQNKKYQKMFAILKDIPTDERNIATYLDKFRDNSKSNQYKLGFADDITDIFEIDE